jgi:hypothetical protein
MPRTTTSRHIKTSPLRRQLTNSAASNHDLATRTRFSGGCALYVHVAHATLQSAVAAACFFSLQSCGPHTTLQSAVASAFLQVVSGGICTPLRPFAGPLYEATHNMHDRAAAVPLKPQTKLSIMLWRTAPFLFPTSTKASSLAPSCATRGGTEARPSVSMPPLADSAS